MKDLSAIRDQVTQLTAKVGQFIQIEAAQFDVSRLEHKGLNDLVSYVDKEAEKQLVTGLSEILPEAAFITEEGTIETQDSEYTWIVDPLDGTTNFIHGLPVYAISIGLRYKDEMVLGVVHELNKNECFHAVKGGGAFCNQERIYVSKASNLSESLVATGFPYYEFDLMQKFLQIMGSFFQKSHGLRRLGSAAVDLAYVACGRFEAYFEYNLKPWDVAGGVVLVQEAGGVVTDFRGGNNYVFGKELCVSNGAAIQAEMLEMIKPLIS